MNSRQIVSLIIAGLLFSGRLASSQVNGIEVSGGATAQVFGGKSPTVQVTDPDGKTLESIPIGKSPGEFIYSKINNTLYVIQNGKKSEHSISAVNLTTQRVDKEINVGSGWSVVMMLSTDDHRLFFFSSGGSKSQPDPQINAIDTASNETIATYDWLSEFREGLPKKNIFSHKMLGAGSGDGSLIVLSEADKPRGLKPLRYRLVVFSGRSSRPVFMVDPGGKVVASMYSKDEKRLFVATEGDKATEGSLVVVDMQKGTTVTHMLSDHPTRLFRLGSEQEPWVLGNEEMRSFSEDGDLAERRIPLNKPRKGEAAGENAGSAFLDGFPGETISLGDNHAAIQINDKNGGSHHKVALIDLKKLQVDGIIETMSAGEKAGIRTQRILLAVALTAATGGNVIFIPNMGFRNESLASRPDGRFLFALDLEGHEVTVVDVQTATVVRRIAVNKSITKLQVASDGKHLICFGRKTQQINLETNDLEN